MLGGRSGAKCTNKCEKYSLNRGKFLDQWVEIASMNEERVEHAACLMNEGRRIYVCGGINTYGDWSNSIEYYDVQREHYSQGRWTLIKLTGWLPCGRVGPLMVPFSASEIIIAGGDQKVAL